MFNLFFSSFNLDLMCSILSCNKFLNEVDLNMVLMLWLKSLIIWNNFGEFVKFGRTESWPWSLLNLFYCIRGYLFNSIKCNKISHWSNQMVLVKSTKQTLAINMPRDKKKNPVNFEVFLVQWNDTNLQSLCIWFSDAYLNNKMLSLWLHASNVWKLQPLQKNVFFPVMFTIVTPHKVTK